ncbi:MAG: protein-glutamate methylesterase/protein-glutamine glutaminase [Candidatus Anammoxibacter sp.]
MIPNSSKKIKVLVVDDSALVRKLLSTYLNRHDDIDVIDTATDPYDARDKIVNLKPDVLTLDIEMPKMDGISFLKKLMVHYPLPVIMVSSLTREGSKATLQALEIGAIDFVAKPSAGSIGEADTFIDDLYEKIVVASVSKVKKSGDANQSGKDYKTPVLNTKTVQGCNEKIIAIGASTGGTEALKEVLIRCPGNLPGIVIVQHMPEIFTKYFAERLNNISAIDVREAEDGMCVSPGTAVVAPGNFQMELQKNGSAYSVRTYQGERVNRHRPSVEVLFNSVSKCAKSNAVGVIMTGMGDDGAQGLLNMKKAGAMTIAQDEESCVVFGMPKEAIRVGAADNVVTLSEITKTIISSLH